jgi:hypothetical protein
MPTTASPTRAAATVESAVLTSVLGVEPVYDGESDSFSSSRIDYAQSVAGTGLLGSTGLQLEPDKWHSPAFLLGDPLYRSDIQAYNEILLFARCEHPETPLSMHFGRWVPNPLAGGGTSLSVALGLYAEPRDEPVKPTIGTSWTKVRIPIPAFASPLWGLAGAEWIYFNSDSLNRRCWIDNMLMRENVGPYVIGIEKISGKMLTIETNKYFELTSARDVQNYYLEDNSTSGKSSPLVPISAGLAYRFQGFKDNSLVSKSRYYIHLLFAEEIDCTKALVFHMSNVTDPALNIMTPATIALSCPTTVLSKSIKVNQIGMAILIYYKHLVWVLFSSYFLID